MIFFQLDDDFAKEADNRLPVSVGCVKYQEIDGVARSLDHVSPPGICASTMIFTTALENRDGG